MEIVGDIEGIVVLVVDTVTEGVADVVGEGLGDGGGFPTKISNLKSVTSPEFPEQLQSGLSTYPQCEEPVVGV
jgi:hypothetical protein